MANHYSGYIFNFEWEEYADSKMEKIESFVAEIFHDKPNSLYAYQVFISFWFMQSLFLILYILFFRNQLGFTIRR